MMLLVCPYMVVARYSWRRRSPRAVTRSGANRCRTFRLRPLSRAPRARRRCDAQPPPRAEANLPTRYPTHRKQQGGEKAVHPEITPVGWRTTVAEDRPLLLLIPP